MKKESNYTLSEARKAVQWYKETYGIDHSHILQMMVVGDSLDEFVNNLYAGNFGKNEKSFLINK